MLFNLTTTFVMVPLVPATAILEGYGVAAPCVVPGWPEGTRIAVAFEKVATGAQLEVGVGVGVGVGVAGVTVGVGLGVGVGGGVGVIPGLMVGVGVGVGCGPSVAL
jgi:hypothetical protein